jgi:hypothetical protein
MLWAQQQDQLFDPQEARQTGPDQPDQDRGVQDQRQDQTLQQDPQRDQLEQQQPQFDQQPGQQRGQFDQQRGEFDAPRDQTQLPADQQARQQQQRGQDGGQAGLGVAVVPDPGAAGVRVARIYPNSPAEAAGIREGDRILEIDGQAIASVDDLLTSIRQSQPGRTVQVAVDRNGVRQSLEAMLQTRAEALSRSGTFGGPQYGSGATPWTDDLSAHIDMLEQEIRRLSDEVADLKSMLSGMPMAHRQGDARQSPQQYGQPQDRPSSDAGQFDQGVRGQSTDQFRPSTPPQDSPPGEQQPGQQGSQPNPGQPGEQQPNES